MSERRTAADQAAEPHDDATRGLHKIFLGFAAGVGKTYAMLDEAHRRKTRGQDVVVGFVETHGRKATAELIGDLEVVPRRVARHRGAEFEELDLPAILARRPKVVLVDELAHSNVPGSEHEKRWEDVETLLDAGISVLSTVNIQHLESLNDVVSDITGVAVRETIPDRVLAQAEEIETVDLPPRALINRLERGDIYPSEKIERARANWFREGNLAALRELALREAAGHVDEDLVEYRSRKKIQKPWAVRDKILICLSPSQASMRLLRRGYRTAQRLHADVVAVIVEEHAPDENQARILHEDAQLAERLQIPVVKLAGRAADQLIAYARDNGITQIVIGHSNRSSLQQRFRSSIITDLVRELKTIDIMVVAAEQA